MTGLEQDAGELAAAVPMTLRVPMSRAKMDPGAANKVLDLKQEQVAELTGLSQPDVSKIVRANLKGWSASKLLGVVLILGGNVKMTVEVPKAEAAARRTPGKLSLVAV